MSDPKLLQVKMQGRMRTGTTSSTLSRGPERLQNITKESDTEDSDDNDSVHQSNTNLAAANTMDWTQEEQATGTTRLTQCSSIMV